MPPSICHMEIREYSTAFEEPFWATESAGDVRRLSRSVLIKPLHTSSYIHIYIYIIIYIICIYMLHRDVIYNELYVYVYIYIVSQQQQGTGHCSLAVRFRAWNHSQIAQHSEGIRWFWLKTVVPIGPQARRLGHFFENRGLEGLGSSMPWKVSGKVKVKAWHFTGRHTHKGQWQFTKRKRRPTHPICSMYGIFTNICPCPKSPCFVGKSTSTIFRKTGHEKWPPQSNRWESQYQLAESPSVFKKKCHLPFLVATTTIFHS